MGAGWWWQHFPVEVIDLNLPEAARPVVMFDDDCACAAAYRGRSTVEDFCNKIHKTMIKHFKYALVWGQSVKHRPQRVGKDHVLMDEDIVQIVKKI